MEKNPYDSFIRELAEVGLIGYRQTEFQLVVSSQKGPVWPDRGNSFWVSRRQENWYLVTWAPRAYKVPAGQNLLALCTTCMALFSSAMARIPQEIVQRYNLQELDEKDYDQLFPADDTED